MRLLWRAPSRRVAWWWALLSLAGIGNIVLWLLLFRHAQSSAGPSVGSDVALMLSLCAAYVFGCAFRSFLPRADVQRYCLFDTWLSSVALGRSVATIAEVSFAMQWALMLSRLGGIADDGLATGIAFAIVPLIVIAQCCSWYGVLTTNYLANAVENSLWALAFALVAVALLRLLPAFDGVMHVALVAAVLGIVGYLGFLVTIDVPMYLARWRDGAAEGGRALDLRAGLRDAATRRVVTHELGHWRDEMPWMTLYFTAAVWASLAICFAYAQDERLPGYLAQPMPHEGQAVSEQLPAASFVKAR